MNKNSFISLTMFFERNFNYLLGINIVEYALRFKSIKKSNKYNQMAYNHTQNLDSLQKRLEQGKSDLLELLDEWYFKNTSERSRIQFAYEKVFGEFEYKINTHYDEAKDIEEKLNHLKTKLNFKNNVSEFNKINTSKKFIKKENPPSFKEGEFNSIYRIIVKKLHPDLNSDSSDFEKYWDNIQFIYKSRDYSRLKMYNETLFSGSDFENPETQTETQIDYLSTKIKEIEKYIFEEKTNLIRLKYEEPFCFEDRLKDHRWVIRHRHLLKSKLNQAKNKVEFNKKLLANMSMRYKILVGEEA